MNTNNDKITTAIRKKAHKRVVEQLVPLMKRRVLFPHLDLVERMSVAEALDNLIGHRALQSFALSLAEGSHRIRGATAPLWGMYVRKMDQDAAVAEAILDALDASYAELKTTSIAYQKALHQAELLDEVFEYVEAVPHPLDPEV